MAPVGEGRVKVVTPLTDIQLLHPVTATMLGRGDRREGKEGREGEGREEGGRRKEWRMGIETRNRQEGENHVNDCKEKQGGREEKGREEKKEKGNNAKRNWKRGKKERGA